MTFSTRARVALVSASLLMAASVEADIVAFDMVGSASQNLIDHDNPWEGAFSSPGDGFEKYQRGVSGSIPFSVLDDSLSVFPADDLGIIGEGNTDVFFGVTDTVNGDSPGEVSAMWDFDISGFSDLSMSLDMGAMGDFEASDFFQWTYSIDGGPIMTLFSSLVAEDATQDYTLDSGTLVSLADPMLVDGTTLTNQLQTLSAALIGSGSLLSLTLTANTDGGSEAFAFQNLIIEGMATVPEPGTVALLLAGLAGFAAARRRR